MFGTKKQIVFGAHPDDIELGMGGTLSKLNVDQIHIMSTTADVNGNKILEETKKSLYGIYGYKPGEKYFIHYFPNQDFRTAFKGLRERLYEIKENRKPEVVLSPYYGSVHPDHAIIGEMVKAIFQEQTVIFYEVIRGDYTFIPNFYIVLDKSNMILKKKALNCYKTQINKRFYFNPDLIMALAKYRGSQVNQKYAEAFIIHRLIGK